MSQISVLLVDDNPGYQRLAKAARADAYIHKSQFGEAQPALMGAWVFGTAPTPPIENEPQDA